MSLSASLLWRGLLAITIGIVSVAWPGVTLGAMVILFAVYAFLAAVTDSFRAFGSDRVGPITGYLLLAALSILAGIVALAWPRMTVLVLTIWIAVWAMITGCVEVGLTFRQGETAGERAMWMLTGLVSIALGAVLFIRPDIGAVSLATAFGLFSIVYGTAAVALSVRARQSAAAGHHLQARIMRNHRRARGVRI